MSVTEKTAPKTRRTLSGKRVPADQPSGVERLLALAGRKKKAPAPEQKVTVTIRKRDTLFEGMSRREARAASRATGRPMSYDRVHDDVDPFEVSGMARKSRRLRNQAREREARKGNRAWQKQNAAIERDNANIEHLIALAGGQIEGHPIGSPMAERAAAALQARLDARQAAG